MTYLTVPIAAPNPDQAAEQIRQALAGGAEMLELRVDYLKALSVNAVRGLIDEVRNAADRSVPIIVTCRDPQQGGAIPHPLKLRIEVLTSALKAGAEFIDFEYENFLKVQNQEKIRLALSRSSKARLILSVHNFETKFNNITKQHRHILTVCPDAIPKLVYTANHINDCFEAFDLLHRTSSERIVLCMGEAGLVSRILAKKLGSFVTFASVDEQSATAPGQLTIEQIKELYRWDEIKPDTELYGVIADPVAHSLSPAIHNVCFAEKRMNKLYLPLLTEGGQGEFNQFLRNAFHRKWLNFVGFSVTIPHKRSALAYTKAVGGAVESLAEKIGAVNTLAIGVNGKLGAYNTDYSAALDAVTSALGITRVDLRDEHVAVIGAGGVARAIVAGLSDVGAKIKIYNRTVQRAEILAAEFACDFAGLDDLPKLDAKLLINCTSIGMHPNVDQMPLPDGCLSRDMAVFDTVYNPAETLLLKQAGQAGAKTIDGISMFVNQALAQFKRFTGQDANPKLMRKTISYELSR